MPASMRRLTRFVFMNSFTFPPPKSGHAVLWRKNRPHRWWRKESGDFFAACQIWNNPIWMHADNSSQEASFLEKQSSLHHWQHEWMSAWTNRTEEKNEKKKRDPLPSHHCYSQYQTKTFKKAKKWIVSRVMALHTVPNCSLSISIHQSCLPPIWLSCL